MEREITTKVRMQYRIMLFACLIRRINTLHTHIHTYDEIVEFSRNPKPYAIAICL